MPRATIIDKLPKDVRDAINRWRVDDCLTIDEIVDKVKEGFGVEIKRATMGLHVQKLEQVGERIRELRAISEGMAKAVGEGDSQKVNNLNRELAHSLLMRLQVAKDGDGKDVKFGPMDVMFISKALDHLAHAEKLDIERALKVKKETAQAAVKVVETVLKADAPGLSAETVAKIKRQVLGVAA